MTVFFIEVLEHLKDNHLWKYQVQEHRFFLLSAIKNDKSQISFNQDNSFQSCFLKLKLETVILRFSSRIFSP